MPYSEYFAVSQSYHPVVSEASIADDNWQDTYPHDTFVRLLIQAEKMLSRQDSKALRPIWIHGAYGTGKTRIAWTLKELLTCSAKQLESYFDAYPELRKENALRDKLLGLKAGDRIVTAMRFSSGNIKSLDDLVIAIYLSVAEELRKQGMNTLEAESLEGAMLKWLDDKVNQDILNAILKADPYCHDGDLPDSAEKVREMLASGREHATLLRKLLEIARERRLLAITFDVDSLIEWLGKVIEGNALKAFVFIWDEFSDFLLANRKMYSDFQKLAQAASKIPFYLLIVTHMTSKLFAEDDPGARVVIDRFTPFQIDLPEYTAFKLIGHALQVKEGMENEWRLISDDINKRLEDARRSVKKMVKPGKNGQGLDVEDFRRILPIHPYAALILKNVAENFSANQRSMFDFIADRDERVKAFQYFIRNHEPGDILSIDHLWDYFYASGKGKLDFGRGNLEANIRLVMDTYPVFADKYTPAGDLTEDSPEQRVLKTVITLQALRYLSPDTEHFKATAENLEIAFEGIDSLNLGQAKIIADKLVADNVLFVDQGLYQVPLGNAVDQAKIISLIDEKRKSERTSTLIRIFSEWDILPTNEPLKTRLSIRKLTSADFNKELNSLINEPGREWAPKVAILFARTPVESDQIQQLLAESLANERANNIIFIDASMTNLPPERWDAYIEASARASYFAGKDDSQSQREKDQANSIIRDWAKQIRNGKFVLYNKRPDNKPRQLSGGDELLEELKNIVMQNYPACQDFSTGVKDTYFKGNVGPAIIKAGIAGVWQNPISKESAVLLLKDIGVDNYWNLLPDNPLAKLRKSLDRKAARAFAPGGSGRIEIREIIEDFMKQGFMPVTLYGWLSGYLLKEFASNQYRYSDGDIGNVMDADHLADMIEKVLKHLQNPNTNYREQYIEVLTEEQRAFVALAKNVFNLTGEESLDRIAISLGQIAKDWGYPFWAFSHAPDAPALQKFISLFIQYLNPEAHNRAGYGEVARDIGKLIHAKPEAEAALKQLFTQENLQKGMVNWLDDFENGELPALGREIGAPDYLGDVRLELTGDAAWLWDDKVCGDVVRNILDDYRLAAKSVEKGFLSHANSRDACLDGWKQQLYGLHIPSSVLQERYPDQKQVLKIFDDLARGRVINKNQRAKLLEMVSENETILHGIFDNALAVFKGAYSHILKDLPDNEITGLYNTLPASSFRDERDTFENELQGRVRSILDKLKRSRLLARWHEITGTDSPATLAERVGTPISTILREIFDSENCREAIQTCKILDNDNAPERAMDVAMVFLNANASVMGNMANQALADKAFGNFIIGANGAVLKDIQKVREEMRQKLGSKVDKWLDYPDWQEIIKGLATEEYKKNGVQAVRQKLAGMSSEQAKTLLGRLGEENFEVGLKILEN